MVVRFAIGWVLFAFSANAASIAGIVLDAETRVPVPGAELVLRYTGVSAHIKSTSSDASGSFRFEIDRPGEYTVETSAPGYFGTEYYSRQPSIKVD